MSNTAELTGRVALVTGATRRAGIGAAIARELAVAGAAVFIAHFRDYDQQKTWGIAPEEPESVLASLGASGAGTEIDLSESSGAVQLFDRAISRFGHVDILVNNAAYWEGGGITDVTAAQLDRHYAVNIRAAVLLCAEFVRRKEPGAGGRIINITSGQGLSPMPGDLAYAVTKAGLDALTLSLSVGLAESGVAVNAIDPGPTDTGWISDGLRARLVAASAAGRIGTPQDVADVVRLLSGDAAAHVTGRIIRLQSNGVVQDFSQLLTRGSDA
jgi:3-oxoacyl-[acyl-carrier protein] reductase